MKPIKSARKLQLHRESRRQMTPRPLSPAELARAVGGLTGAAVDPAALADTGTHTTCPMTSI